MTDKYLSRPEEIVLMAVFRLKGNAYGVSIRVLVQEMTGKYWSIGSVYVPLERLEKKGYLSSSTSDPLPERGGRRKRVFRITAAGVRELNKLYRINEAVWQDYSGLNPEKKK
ncbi:PadR family transcriptional regulator [Acidobacteriota bacterium]